MKIYDTFHDFNDTLGFVPAHRHKNPDGSLGGWVAETATVDKYCIIAPDAKVFHRAKVLDNSCISGNAMVCGDATIKNNVIVKDSAYVGGRALICLNALIEDRATVYGDVNICGKLVTISGQARLFGSPTIRDWTIISDYSVVKGMAVVSDYAIIKGHAVIHENAFVGGHTKVFGNANICGNCKIIGNGWISGGTISGLYIFNRNTQITGGVWK